MIRHQQQEQETRWDKKGQDGWRRGKKRQDEKRQDNERRNLSTVQQSRIEANREKECWELKIDNRVGKRREDKRGRLLYRWIALRKKINFLSTTVTTRSLTES